METFSALLALCAGNSAVTSEFPAHNVDASDLRCHRALYDVIVMVLEYAAMFSCQDYLIICPGVDVTQTKLNHNSCYLTMILILLLMCYHAGSHLNIKMVFPSMGIPIIKIRRLSDRLIFIMGIPKWVSWFLYIEMTPNQSEVRMLENDPTPTIMVTVQFLPMAAISPMGIVIGHCIHTSLRPYVCLSIPNDFPALTF